jgi:UDP-N-acetylglucosamine acyltransferase
MADAGTENLTVTTTPVASLDGTASAGLDGVSPDGVSPVKPAKRERNPRVQLPKEAFPPLPMPLGYEEICKILPHRYPLLLVDKILEIEPGVRCVGIKNVTANEEFFLGHFPGHPVMPGVLILEAMAQVAGVLTLVSRNTPGALSYFAKIESARFHQPVVPGDQIVTEATLNVLRGDYCKVSVVGRVDEQIVVEGDYTFMTRTDPSTTSVIQNHAANSLAQNGALPMTASSSAPDIQVSTQNAAPLSNGSSVTNGSAAVVANVSPQPEEKEVVAPRTYEGKTYVHPTAIVAPDAKLAESVWIGPYCVIEGGTSIGRGTILESHAVIKRGTSIGERCRIWPNVILGHDPQDLKFKGEESYLRIGNDNILREMVTIHRATGEGQATTIGNNNMLMAYVHIGHNCTIGNNNMISNSTGLSGHVTIEDKVVIGGFVGIHQFVHIGKMAMIGGLSKIVQDVPPFCTCDGRPARVHGLNIRGLRRNGVTSEVRNQVSTAFKLLYRSGLNTTQALDRICEEVPNSETLDYFINFIERVREGRLGRQDEAPHL